MKSSPAESSAPSPGYDLHAKVRAGFTAQGTSLYRWCTDHGVRRTAADKVLLGERNGPEAKALRLRLVDAAQAQSAPFVATGAELTSQQQSAFLHALSVLKTQYEEIEQRNPYPLRSRDLAQLRQTSRTLRALLADLKSSSPEQRVSLMAATKALHF